MGGRSYLRAMMVGLIFISACGGGDDAVTSTTTSVAPVTTTSSSSPSSTSTPPPETTTTTEPAADVDLPEEIERTDWLTFANGATIVAVDGLPEGSAGEAIKT